MMKHCEQGPNKAGHLARRVILSQEADMTTRKRKPLKTGHLERLWMEFPGRTARMRRRTT
jgi:hypothetical protein